MTLSAVRFVVNTVLAGSNVLSISGTPGCREPVACRQLGMVGRTLSKRPKSISSESKHPIQLMQNSERQGLVTNDCAVLLVIP